MIRATTAVFRRAARRNEAWAAGDIGELLHSLARALFDPYRPELHYMRGPGPKWHAKHDRPNQPAATLAALPLTPTRPSNAVAAPVKLGSRIAGPARIAAETNRMLCMLDSLPGESLEKAKHAGLSAGPKFRIARPHSRSNRC